MRSRAQIKSHPLHPILIPFPIAFFTGALLADVAAVLTGTEHYWRTGQTVAIAGVVAALLAAVPGIIDYVNTVPPNSSAKKRGAKHGLLNTTVLLIFAAVSYYRRQDGFSETLVIAAEAIGVVLLLVAGWMGGTLVHRNQIGIDHRYANAEKWNEGYYDESSSSIAVATADELGINSMKLLHIKDKRIVLARTEEKYVAFDDHCTHKGGSLADGSMMCGTVQCPWHGAQFNVYTGAVTCGPAEKNIGVYTVTQKDGQVFLTF